MQAFESGLLCAYIHYAVKLAVTPREAAERHVCEPRTGYVGEKKC